MYGQRIISAVRQGKIDPSNEGIGAEPTTEDSKNVESWSNWVWLLGPEVNP